MNKKLFKMKFAAKWRRWLAHPLLLIAAKGFTNCKIHITGHSKIPEKPVLFAVNHTNGNDFPVIAQVIKKHFFILTASTMKEDVFSNIFVWLNGAVYVDRTNAVSKHASKIEMLQLLENGNHVLIFPEGTWNTDPNKLMLPFNWGIIDISQQAKVPIIPIVLEYIDNDVYVSIGKEFVSRGNKAEGCSHLRDVMASMKWELMMQHSSKLKRELLPINYCEQCLNELIGTWKNFDFEFESSLIRKVIDPDAFSHLNNISPTLQNAFLFNKRLS